MYYDSLHSGPHPAKHLMLSIWIASVKSVGILVYFAGSNDGRCSVNRSHLKQGLRDETIYVPITI